MRAIGWVLSAFPFLCGAQTAIMGRIVDAQSGAPLEYVSIGSLPVGAFTLSRVDGSFRLHVPDSIRCDSVRFVMVGYVPMTMALARIQGTDAVRLEPATVELADVEVTGAVRVERKLGNRSHHLLFNYALEERTPDDVIEVAQVIELGGVPVGIRAVNLFISDTPMDSATFRIRFRGFDGERPTGPLVDRSIVRRVALPEGWLVFDLQDERIRLKGTVVLTLELLPEQGSGKRWISVGIRLGGGRPAFDRRGTFEQWVRMPHRYSINVSAMVPVEMPEQEAEDPDPFQHAVDLRLASAAVGDTFCIAFGLPEDYDPGRPGGYPVVYLLDANVYFNDVVDQYRREARKGRSPPVIVIGVGYTDVGAADTLRERDYVLVHTDSMRCSGGGGHFLSFLEDELVPLVRERYPTDSTRCALAGHSLGGHLVLFALVERELHGALPFNTFLAASPSVDVAHDALVHALEGLASEEPTPHRSVFISHGEGEDDTAMRRTVELVERCVRSGVVEKHYPGAEHMGTAMRSFTDGLRMMWGEGDRD